MSWYSTSGNFHPLGFSIILTKISVTIRVLIFL
nr:MAG TPA: hypothetical protein [Caudoviricetes sp.]